MSIHPTAIIHKGAELDPTVEVGPFCVVGARVKIGPHTRLISHVVVENHTTLGAHNLVHPFACLGGNPQDKKFKAEDARLVIGDHNVIREAVTMNIGTGGGHMETRIGSHCMFMAYAHVAHDCRLGNNIVLANGVALAGHVDIDDNVGLGGLVAVHQFCRIGRFAYVGGGSMVAQDVPPFCIAQGDRARLAGINVIGLKRAGWDRGRIQAVHTAFKTIFFNATTRQAGLTEVDASPGSECVEVVEMLAFIRSAARGVCAGRRPAEGDDDTA